jgi:hypothetical protein
MLLRPCPFATGLCWHTATWMTRSAPELVCTSLQYDILQSAGMFCIELHFTLLPTLSYISFTFNFWVNRFRHVVVLIQAEGQAVSDSESIASMLYNALHQRRKVHTEFVL